MSTMKSGVLLGKLLPPSSGANTIIDTFNVFLGEACIMKFPKPNFVPFINVKKDPSEENSERCCYVQKEDSTRNTSLVTELTNKANI